MKPVVAILTLACGVAGADAAVLPIQGQYTLNAGHNSMWYEDGTGGCRSAGQCYTIPQGLQVLGCTGTQTIKNTRTEVLGRIVVGRSGTPSIEPIWMGEHKSTITDNASGQQFPGNPTVAITTGPLRDDSLYVGDGTNAIWFEYQADNDSGLASTYGLEVQASCTLGVPVE